MVTTLLLIVTFVFDLLAFALAIVAELKRSTAVLQADSEKNYVYCVYDSSIATVLGMGAFIFLIGSQTIIMVVTQCLCCGKDVMRAGAAKVHTLILFTTFWVTFFVAETLLLVGSIQNAQHTKYRSFFGSGIDCRTSPKGIFAVGAVFIFFKGIVTEFYYCCYLKATEEKVSDPCENGSDYTILNQ